MKTTVEVPDELMREIKVRAAREGRKLKDVIAELLQRGLESSAIEPPRRRIEFPLIKTAHPAARGNELTPDETHQILLDQEVDWLVK